MAWNKDVPALPIANGERVEALIVDQTKITHPMNLHEHQFRVVEID